MNRRLFLGFPFVAVAISLADRADACAVSHPPYFGIKRPADVIVAGAVAWSRTENEPNPSNLRWRGVITVDGVALGKPDAKSYPITDEGWICGPWFPKAQVGDLWVVYLRRDRSKGRLLPVYSAPLLGARKLDPRLKALKWR